MPVIVTLVIYLSASDAADPATPVLVRSAQEILGSSARVTLREAPQAVRDGDLAELAPDADAVADIAWLGGNHRYAQIRCYLKKSHRLLKRQITFDEQSARTERERMLGFVVASMLPPVSDTELGTDAAPQTAHIETALPTPHARLPVVEHSATPAERFVGVVEVVGLGVTGVNGSASTFGASLGARRFFGRTLALRIAGGLRRGNIPAAGSTSEVDFVGLGLAFESPVANGSRFAVGGRAGVLVLRHVVAHLSDDDLEPDSKSRVLPGADVMAEGAWHFSTSAALVTGLGTELAFGRTDVFVKGKEITDIPPLRVVAELGIQAKF